MAATLNISALAHRTGVPPDTIRKWEQRYGVLHPERTRGGQRRYSELDLSRVEWLKARLEEGYRVGEAAAILDQGEPPTGTLAEQRVEFHAGDPCGRRRAHRTHSRARTPHGRARGGGRRAARARAARAR